MADKSEQFRKSIAKLRSNKATKNQLSKVDETLRAKISKLSDKLIKSNQEIYTYVELALNRIDTIEKVIEQEPEEFTKIVELEAEVQQLKDWIIDNTKNKKLETREEKKKYKELTKRVEKLEKRKGVKAPVQQGESETALPESIPDTDRLKAYKQADKVNKKGYSDTIADKIVGGQGIGESISNTLSDKAKAFGTNFKRKFDPVNIAKGIGGRGAAAIVGKKLGRTQKELEYYTDHEKGKTLAPGTVNPETGEIETASKVKGEDSGDSGDLVPVLNDIYGFLKKNREEDAKVREEEKSKETDKKEDKEKKHKELLAAIAALTGAPTEGGTATKDDSDSGGGILGALAGTGALGVLKKAKGLLKGGKAAAGAAEGLAEGAAKSATKVSKLLESAKGVLKFLEKIPGLSLIAAGASLIFDVKSAIDKHEAGEIGDQELKKEVVSSVGGALGGLGGAELGSLLGGSIGSVVPGAGTLVGGILGGTAGFFGGEKLGKYAAEKMFDYFGGGKEAEPPSNPQDEAQKLQETKAAPAAPAPSSGSSAPTASPVSKTTSESSAKAPASSTSSPSSPSGAAPKPAAAPTSSPNPGGKLQQATAQNQQAKLETDSKKSEPVVVNNQASASSPAESPTNQSLPSVRNKDDTLERIIFYSTRVV
jgi:hypothetical protein